MPRPLKTVEEKSERKRIYARKYRAEHLETERAKQRKKYYKKNGVGEIATEDEILFYGYKEPLRKFEGGHGYQGVLSFSKDRDKVQCHFCGGLFHMLTNKHLQTHGLTAKEYKVKTGLANTAALIGEGTRSKMIQYAIPEGAIYKAIAKRKQNIKEGWKNPQKGKKLSLEIRNKRGNCPDQLLDVINKTVKSFGRVPTYREFREFHKGRYVGIIEKTYGSWSKALLKLKLTTAGDEKHYTREELLEGMRNFYAVNNRPPHYSDCSRGLLPSDKTYQYHFKGLNHARLEAGIPLVIRVGSHVEYWNPTQKEREKMLAQWN